jgi:hypothetical protein
MENWQNRRAKNTKQKNRIFRIEGGKKMKAWARAETTWRQ